MTFTPLQDNYIQTRVSAEVVDPQTGEMSITNVFHFTFLAKEKTPPFIVPKTYHEVGKYDKTGSRIFSQAMMYLTGRRHFKACTNL